MTSPPDPTKFGETGRANPAARTARAPGGIPRCVPGFVFSRVLVSNSHMRYVARSLEPLLQKTARRFPAIVLTGPRRGGGLSLVECKATRTPTPAMAAPLQRLAAAARKRRRGSVRCFVVHQPRAGGASTRALTPGVEALPWPGLVDELSVHRPRSAFRSSAPHAIHAPPGGRSLFRDSRPCAAGARRPRDAEALHAAAQRARREAERLGGAALALDAPAAAA